MSCISVQKHVNYGEVILIVGDCHKIQWNVQNGIQMQWNQDDIWTVTLDSCCLPMNYRYVVVKQVSRQIIEWEDGVTRVFNSHQDVQDIWGHLRITLKLMNYPDSNLTLNFYTQTGRDIRSHSIELRENAHLLFRSRINLFINWLINTNPTKSGKEVVCV
ncbi:unnamed protein product (macronuclear) [Paramecium tetraurelia]|uniref:CBM20 domain-containing protein n=1 Tax=Paramecium tetraurelia TaxID=5888 RepID=A0EA92_PARTE|nr:uncharacterized protein GSPATT00024941001 [Paramecium tetraurelia]CAK92209.1 unnamed protein product [Paramecium tetraurelia]|eukprot:XP_001459606.1 hypothetical protein (macronuclear) [Paramecium tetraurelia strain d4-2]